MLSTLNKVMFSSSGPSILLAACSGKDAYRAHLAEMNGLNSVEVIAKILPAAGKEKAGAGNVAELMPNGVFKTAKERRTRGGELAFIRRSFEGSPFSRRRRQFAFLPRKVGDSGRDGRESEESWLAGGEYPSIFQDGKSNMESGGRRAACTSTEANRASDRIGSARSDERRNGHKCQRAS